MMAHATLLLPLAAHFAGQPINENCARVLGRADRNRHEAGRRAQLLRHFRLIPNHWPMAALTRQADAGEAAGSAWLRADPAYVRPDINGARLMAFGDALALTAEDCAALLPALRPLFGDAGFPIDAPVPSRWYLRMPVEARVPAFTEPDDALGTDLFEHLAEGGGEARRWRALLSEAQVVLHNHPWNARRIAQGRVPVNSLWFWGAGVLPDAVRTVHAAVCSDNDEARALAIAAGAAQSLPDRFPAIDDDAAFDLPALRDLARFQEAWLQPALVALRRGELQSVGLDFADGGVIQLTHSQRWRFWRRPLARLDA